MPGERSPPKKRPRKPTTMRTSLNPDLKREIDQMFANLLFVRRQIRKLAKGKKKGGA